MRNNIPIRERENESDTLKLKTLFGNALKALVYSGAFLIPAGNEPGGHACMHIWRLTRGSATPLFFSRGVDCKESGNVLPDKKDTKKKKAANCISHRAYSRSFSFFVLSVNSSIIKFGVGTKFAVFPLNGLFLPAAVW